MSIAGRSGIGLDTICEPTLSGARAWVHDPLNWWAERSERNTTIMVNPFAK